ncbi:aldose 1-epimerase family protein [Thalassoglobus sp. JC818]|uniref:aldose 1-epimerase family protein n=1 Tax=Thalassoglobus sp. JC818 TaxID=3232136 RepID=UPI003457AF0A
MSADLRSDSVCLGGSAPGADLPWEVLQTRMTDGLSAGVEVIEVRNGVFSFNVLPTRGMGIWTAHFGETRFGWDSPVKAPVNPAFVNLKSRHGLGWLDGFNELLCRCGLSFNGPPGIDEGNPSPIESDLTLHGKIANLPAHSVELISNENEIGVRGIVDESTLFGPQLRLESSITSPLGSTEIRVRDVVTNLGSAPTELQLLYHVNLGSPILEEGARFACPARKVIPRDARAAEDTTGYREYLAPTSGYSEQVYFHETLTNSSGESLAMIQNASGDCGLSLRFKKEQLPCFSQWKCTQAMSDGYVTGIEPATNYPNFKSFEREQGRVVQLNAGESYTVDLILKALVDQKHVAEARSEIEAIQGEESCEVISSPQKPYCSTE